MQDENNTRKSNDNDDLCSMEIDKALDINWMALLSNDTKGHIDNDKKTHQQW